MDFHGSLNEFHIPDIIQFLSGAGKTGVLCLASDGREGVIFLEGGKVKHAAFSDLEGEEAVYELMLLTHGTFDFEPEVATESSSVTKSNTNLLIESARRKDEWKVIRERVPHVEWVPEFVLPDPNDTGKQVTLNTSEWVILSKIDGAHTVKEIAQASKLSVFQTCRLLFSLISTGFIRLREPGPPAESTVQFPD